MISKLMKTFATFAAAFAATGGLLSPQDSHANSAISSLNSVISSTRHISKGGSARSLQQQQEYDEALSYLITNPVEQNINFAKDRGFSHEYVPYISGCSSKINAQRMVTDIKNVSREMRNNFNKCVHEEYVTATARTPAQKAAIETLIGAIMIAGIGGTFMMLRKG